jgi:hypothetical protein
VTRGDDAESRRRGDAEATEVHMQAHADGNSTVFQAGRDLNIHLPPPPRFLAGLPPDTAGFVARDGQIAKLLAVLNPAHAGQSVATITGMAGVGKTALAVHVAHTAMRRGWFPGGALFVDLMGYSPDGAVSGDEAIRMLLRALGVPDAQHLPTPGERASQYRSALESCGPVLVVADNASASDQVLPLLPGLGRHGFLVTSRHTLSRMRGALKIDLDVLSTPHAVELIEHALRLADQADERCAREAETAVRLAELCGWLPLALQITAALIEVEPAGTLASVASRLADERTRLDALNYDEPGQFGIRAALELSYLHLDEAHRRLFRLLAVNPRHQTGEQAARYRALQVRLDPDLHTEAAAELIEKDAATTGQTLRALARAHLIVSLGNEYWRMHDLVLLFAREKALAEKDDSSGEALQRLLNYQLRTNFVTDTGITLHAEGHGDWRVEWRKGPRAWVVVPPAPGMWITPDEQPPPNFAWSDEEQAWVDTTPSELPDDANCRLVARRLADLGANSRPTTLSIVATSSGLSIPEIRAAMVAFQRSGHVRMVGAGDVPVEATTVAEHARWRAYYL